MPAVSPEYLIEIKKFVCKITKLKNVLIQFYSSLIPVEKNENAL